MRLDDKDGRVDTAIQARTIARTLLRVAQWRQQHFHPTKPLPKDVTAQTAKAPIYRRAFPRVFVDLSSNHLSMGIYPSQVVLDQNIPCDPDWSANKKRKQVVRRCVVSVMWEHALFFLLHNLNRAGWSAKRSRDERYAARPARRSGFVATRPIYHPQPSSTLLGSPIIIDLYLII
jgi:hypothetical protein